MECGQPRCGGIFEQKHRRCVVSTDPKAYQSVWAYLFRQASLVLPVNLKRFQQF